MASEVQGLVGGGETLLQPMPDSGRLLMRIILPSERAWFSLARGEPRALMRYSSHEKARPCYKGDVIATPCPDRGHRCCGLSELARERGRRDPRRLRASTSQAREPSCLSFHFVGKCHQCRRRARIATTRATPVEVQQSPVLTPCPRCRHVVYRSVRRELKGVNHVNSGLKQRHRGRHDLPPSRFEDSVTLLPDLALQADVLRALPGARRLFPREPINDALDCRG